MPRDRKYWEERAARWFEEWDKIPDPYNLPMEEFRKALLKLNEASLISLILSDIKEEHGTTER
jgi:hypothetical protein